MWFIRFDLSMNSFQGFICLVLTLGPKQAFKMSIRYPAMVIMPIFTIWTFGPTSMKKCFSACCQNQLIKVSYPLTWLNLIISTTSVLLNTNLYKNTAKIVEGDFDGGFERMFSFFAMLFLTPAWITFIIQQLIDKHDWKSLSLKAAQNSGRTWRIH